MRAWWKLLRLGVHVLLGALILGFLRVRLRLGQRPRWVPATVRRWHARLCRILGVRIRLQGRLEPACLLVCNHISWLDIPVLGAQGELSFLSKAEVREWPVIGWMAALAGTLFIERGANQTETLNTTISALLHQGRSVLIFPEGTTTDGTQVHRFFPRLFAPAQNDAVRIQPIALRYHEGNDPAPTPVAAYIGDDTLIASLWRIARHRDLVVDVYCLPAITGGPDHTRRALAEQARTAVATALGVGEQTSSATADAEADTYATLPVEFHPRPA